MTKQIKVLVLACGIGLAGAISSNAGENKAFKVPSEPFKIKTEHHKDDDVICERKGSELPICCEGKGQFACFSEDAMDAIIELKRYEAEEEPIEMVEVRAIYRHKLIMKRLADIEKHIEREDYNSMVESLLDISLEDIYQKIEENKEHNNMRAYLKTHEWLKEKVCK